MNIEEANDNLIMLKYFLQEEGDENWEKYCEAIETLLTAYEKEKEKNKITKQMNENLIEALKESISKDKIKTIIEEVQKDLENSKDAIEANIILGKKLILQSLLDKEE